MGTPPAFAHFHLKELLHDESWPSKIAKSNGRTLVHAKLDLCKPTKVDNENNLSPLVTLLRLLHSWCRQTYLTPDRASCIDKDSEDLSMHPDPSHI